MSVVSTGVVEARAFLDLAHAAGGVGPWYLSLSELTAAHAPGSRHLRQHSGRAAGRPRQTTAPVPREPPVTNGAPRAGRTC